MSAQQIAQAKVLLWNVFEASLERLGVPAAEQAKLQQDVGNAIDLIVEAARQP